MKTRSEVISCRTSIAVPPTPAPRCSVKRRTRDVQRTCGPSASCSTPSSSAVSHSTIPILFHCCAKSAVASTPYRTPCRHRRAVSFAVCFAASRISGLTLRMFSDTLGFPDKTLWRCQDMDQQRYRVKSRQRWRVTRLSRAVSRLAQQAPLRSVTSTVDLQISMMLLCCRSEEGAVNYWLCYLLMCVGMPLLLPGGATIGVSSLTAVIFPQAAVCVSCGARNCLFSTEG